MIFGPFPIFFVNGLRDKLKVHGGACRIYSSKEAIASYEEKRLSQSISLYPSSEPLEDLLYIEIETEHLLIVKSDLEKMGVAVGEVENIRRRSFDPQLETSEYLCPKCDFRSSSHAPCPKHMLPVVEFSEWAKAISGRREKIAIRLLLCFFGVLAFFVIREFLSR